MLEANRDDLAELLERLRDNQGAQVEAMGPLPVWVYEQLLLWIRKVQTGEDRT